MKEMDKCMIKHTHILQELRLPSTCA